jgi:hypothetical protein
MPNRFWVGGTGNWDGTTTHWSASSGGAAGASVPTAADDVYFDANSGGGTVTVNTSNRLCLSLSFRGLSGTSDYTGSFAQSGTGAVFITGGLVLSASTTYSSYTGALTFNGTTSYNVTSNGVIWPGSNITISGAGLSVSCTDAFATTGIVTMTQGSISGSTISVGSLTITSNALTRNISFTSVSFTGAGTLATIGATQTNLTFSVGDFYITGAQALARSLATTGIFYPTNAIVYLAGSGSGTMTFTSTTSTGVYCNVIVTNTGGASISLGTGIYINITFQSGTNAVWSNTATQTLTCIGNVTLTSTQGTPVLTPSITLNGAGGNSQTITSAGKSFVAGTITIADAGNNVAYTFADAFTTSGPVTITNSGLSNAAANGTFTTSALFTLTAGLFITSTDAYIGQITTSNSNSRTFQIGGTLYLTGLGTLITATTVTGLTWSTNSIIVTGAQTSARTLTFNTVVYPGNGYCELGGTGSGSITLAPGTTGDPRVYVTNTGGAVVSFSTGNVAELIFSGGTNVVWTNGGSQTVTIDGDLTLVSTMGNPTNTPSFIFKGSGYALANNSRITLAGKSLVTGSITLNDTLGPGAGNGTFTFVDAFSSNALLSVASAGTVNINSTFTLTNAAVTITGVGLFLINGNFNIGTGTFTFTSSTINSSIYVYNGANVTCGIFSSSNTNTRVLYMGSGTWSLTGTGTVWNLATSTNMGLDPQKSRIVITDTSATAVTFAGGSIVYYTLEYARGGGGGTLTLSGNNAFVNFIDTTSTAAHSLIFTAASVNNFVRFNVRGSAGALITINSTTTAAHSLSRQGRGIVNCDYLNIQHSVASPASTWYAGANSTNNQAVATVGSGWIFTIPPSSQSLLSSGGVG